MINSIDDDYDSEKVVYIGWLFEFKTPVINRVNGSQYGRGTDFKQDIVEYAGNNCYILTSGNCFKKCFYHLTGRDNTEQFLSNVMTQARVSPFCRKKNINICLYDVFRVCPINITERIIALYMYKTIFN